MGTRYVLRVQADPADEPAQVAERMVRLAERTGAEELCVFLFGMEFNDGNEPLDRIGHWLDRTRPWRAAVRAAGIAVSLNPGHTLGHCDWGRPRRDDWQPMVDQRGRAADVVVCPLDPGWRAYFAETLRRYVAEDLAAVWIEDDIRLHNHARWSGAAASARCIWPSSPRCPAWPPPVKKWSPPVRRPARRTRGDSCGWTCGKAPSSTWSGPGRRSPPPAESAWA